MSINATAYQQILNELTNAKAQLVAVSKTKPVEDIAALYALGQIDFGENYVQELVEKQAALPSNIRWHFIGHLQTNKVKYIAPFVSLIHGVDSLKLLKEISKQAVKNNRTIDCLLQIHIATEESKFGFNVEELRALQLELPLPNIVIRGLMGMATNTSHTPLIEAEFAGLHQLYLSLQKDLTSVDTLSMGMSGDYQLALQNGSNMVRIGSLLFGVRNYPNA